MVTKAVCARFLDTFHARILLQETLNLHWFVHFHYGYIHLFRLPFLAAVLVRVTAEIRFPPEEERHVQQLVKAKVSQSSLLFKLFSPLLLCVQEGKLIEETLKFSSVSHFMVT
ncbi:hypothetical protein ILYODFUR_009543 [Ilyodon furcidens]|uniref:Uncharacterized protein n=1 Tax=Ilyodon furcidens TaxID=33524 RepID=A0ABV0TTC3_9TELE